MQSNEDNRDGVERRADAACETTYAQTKSSPGLNRCNRCAFVCTWIRHRTSTSTLALFGLGQPLNKLRLKRLYARVSACSCHRRRSPWDRLKRSYIDLGQVWLDGDHPWRLRILHGTRSGNFVVNESSRSTLTPGCCSSAASGCSAMSW